MVLHPDMIRKLKPGQDTSYCNALRSFLQTDVKWFVSFQPFASFHDDIDNYINNLVHGEMTAMQWISSFDQISSITNKDSNEIFSFLEGKAREATIVPFSVYSNLFHQRFNRHRFLESTLEILQAILHCYREMWWTVPPLSQGSVPIFREIYEMSQACLVYYSWNWWNIIERSFCNATLLEYPLDTWCWLGSSLDILSSFVHINWILWSFKNIFQKFFRQDEWCSSPSILLQQQML
jgi:hypothetical protein